VVLGPFAGTGSALVAALHLGRRGLGCEVDERHSTFAVERIGALPGVESTQFCDGDALGCFPRRAADGQGVFLFQVLFQGSVGVVLRTEAIYSLPRFFLHHWPAGRGVRGKSG